MTMQAKSTLHWKTGEKLLAKNRTKQALYQFNEAIRLERNFNYYNSRGLTYLRLGDSKHAVEDFMEATRLEPDDVVAYYNLVQVYTLEGEEKAAHQLIKRFQALGKDPGALEKLMGSVRRPEPDPTSLLP